MARKGTPPYMIGKCKWDKELESWVFAWGEPIPDEWVRFSRKSGIPVETINAAHEYDPTGFELNIDVIEDIIDAKDMR